MIDANLQKYLSFVKTVELGSFSKAAEALDYSQSGISRMIADLEKEWNIILLERDRNGVRLTSDGMRLLPYARNLCEEYFRLQEQVDELKGIQSGLIRIGTFSSVATHWLPKIIKRFQMDYPNIEYEMLLGDYTEIETWIAEGRVDCGFLRLPTRPEFDVIELEQDELMAVIPEDHPLAGAETFPVQVFADEPFMLRRIPYHVVVKPFDYPAYRMIGLAMKNRKTASAAVKRFIEYLDYRDDDAYTE